MGYFVQRFTYFGSSMDDRQEFLEAAQNILFLIEGNRLRNPSPRMVLELRARLARADNIFANNIVYAGAPLSYCSEQISV